MPKLIVGYSQKVGEPNFGSRGASVSVEMDLDGLPSNPGLMKTQVAGLFHLAREAVAGELAKHSAESAPLPLSSMPTKALLPMNRNGFDGHGRMATPNQVKALFGLARRAGFDLKQLIAERFQVRRPDDLSIKDASMLIDELRRVTESTPAAG